MARRRQLEPPSPEALKELEEGFARENRSGLRMPIADVVGEAAAMAHKIICTVGQYISSNIRGQEVLRR